MKLCPVCSTCYIEVVGMGMHIVADPLLLSTQYILGGGGICMYILYVTHTVWIVLGANHKMPKLSDIFLQSEVLAGATRNKVSINWRISFTPHSNSHFINLPHIHTHSELEQKNQKMCKIQEENYPPQLDSAQDPCFIFFEKLNFYSMLGLRLG